MERQELVERLKAQHHQALARLHGELVAAYDEVVSRFADWFPDPRPDVGIITELKAQLSQLEQGQLATAHGELHRLTKTTTPGTSQRG